jgi:hypothetical protein
MTEEVDEVGRFAGAKDGNVLGGILGEAFAAELTSSEATCAGCTRLAVVADLVVYDAGPGITARCRGCGAVMLRAARIRALWVLDLSGVDQLRIHASESG